MGNIIKEDIIQKDMMGEFTVMRGRLNKKFEEIQSNLTILNKLLLFPYKFIVPHQDEAFWVTTINAYAYHALLLLMAVTESKKGGLSILKFQRIINTRFKKKNGLMSKPAKALFDELMQFEIPTSRLELVKVRDKQLAHFDNKIIGKGLHYRFPVNLLNDLFDECFGWFNRWYFDTANEPYADGLHPNHINPLDRLMAEETKASSIYSMEVHYPVELFNNWDEEVQTKLIQWHKIMKQQNVEVGFPVDIE